MRQEDGIYMMPESYKKMYSEIETLKEQVKQLQIEIVRIKNTRSEMIDVISI